MQGPFTKEIEKLFRERYQQLCTLSYSFVGDMDKAEDIVQDVFVSLLLKGGLHVLNLEVYVKVAVKNASLNAKMRFPKTEPLNDEILRVAAIENLTPRDWENHGQLIKAVESLPIQCRKVFKLCVIEGLKYRSVSESMGISINTVKTHMKKAYKTLRLELRKTYFLTLIIIVLFLR